MLYTICIALILIASVLVILAVLVQNPKSGMAANFGASNQVMGVRETSDFLEKFTWTMAIAIVVLSLVATLAMTRGASQRAIAKFRRTPRHFRSVSLRPRRPPRCPRLRFRHRLRPKPLRSSPPNRVVSRRLPLTDGKQKTKDCGSDSAVFFVLCISCIHFLLAFLLPPPVPRVPRVPGVPRIFSVLCPPPSSSASAFGFFVCPCLLPPSFPALPLQPMLLVPRNLFMCDLSFFCYLRLPSYYCILFEPLPGASSSWGCPLFASSPRSTLLPPPFPL